jgi:hypothetical protein
MMMAMLMVSMEDSDCEISNLLGGVLPQNVPSDFDL